MYDVKVTKQKFFVVVVERINLLINAEKDAWILGRVYNMSAVLNMLHQKLLIFTFADTNNTVYIVMKISS